MNRGIVKLASMGEKKETGFTLMELMVVVGIVAVLAVVALPGYQNYVRKAKRADAMDALLVIQNLQERYRANNPTYGTLTDIGFDGTDSLEGYYTIALGDTVSATEYSVTATGVGDQADDKVGSTTCTMVITVDADNPRGLKTPEDCW